MITLPFTVLQFISGVYVPFNDVPALDAATSASFFPLKWMAQGMRSVFLPAAGRSARAGAQLGARPHRAGAGRLDRGRIGAVREDVPLAVPRLSREQARGRPAGPARPEPRHADAPGGDVTSRAGSRLRGDLGGRRGHRAGGCRLSASGRIIASAALAAMVPVVRVPRPPAADARIEPRWRTEAPARAVYLAGLVVLFAVAQSQNPNAWFLAFALCPQCFHVTTARRGMAFVVVFNVVAGALRRPGASPGLAGALTALGIALFAVGVLVRLQPLDDPGHRRRAWNGPR